MCHTYKPLDEFNRCASSWNNNVKLLYDDLDEPLIDTNQIQKIITLVKSDNIVEMLYDDLDD